MDPKLKETYDRVMATTVPSTSPPVQPVQPMPQPTSAAPAQTPFVQPPQPQVTQPIPPPQMETGQQAPPVGNTKPAAAFVAAAPKPKGKMLFLLFLVGGLIFFIVYGIFWMKFFNLSVPFLPF